MEVIEKYKTHKWEYTLVDNNVVYGTLTTQFRKSNDYLFDWAGKEIDIKRDEKISMVWDKLKEARGVAEKNKEFDIVDDIERILNKIANKPTEKERRFKIFTYSEIEDGYKDIRDTNLVIQKGEQSIVLRIDEIKQIEKAIGAKFQL